MGLSPAARRAAFWSLGGLALAALAVAALAVAFAWPSPAAWLGGALGVVVAVVLAEVALLLAERAAGADAEPEFEL